jgi:Gnt-I system high-affinity gluconate transporter
MLTSLSVMHGFLPPHPSPVALVSQFKADMATTFFYGTIISVPAIIIAGPLFSKTLKKIRSTTIHIPLCVTETPGPEPGVANSLVSSLLPILIIGITAAILPFVDRSPAAADVLHFIGEPNVALTITILTATYTLGIRLGRKLSDVMRLYGEAVKDIAMILLTIGSAGILKQIFVDSGANVEIGDALASLALPPLLLAWFLAAMLRLALGSATVAGLTAAGIIYPLTTGIPVNPNLLVLAIGAGSLFCSHVNDSAFWLFKEYFGLTMKDTFRSWTMMESLVSIIGLGGVLILDQIV